MDESKIEELLSSFWDSSSGSIDLSQRKKYKVDESKIEELLSSTPDTERHLPYKGRKDETYILSSILNISHPRQLATVTGRLLSSFDRCCSKLMNNPKRLDIIFFAGKVEDLTKVGGVVYRSAIEKITGKAGGSIQFLINDMVENDKLLFELSERDRVERKKALRLLHRSVTQSRASDYNFDNIKWYGLTIKGEILYRAFYEDLQDYVPNLDKIQDLKFQLQKTHKQHTHEQNKEQRKQEQNEVKEYIKDFQRRMMRKIRYEHYEKSDLSEAVAEEIQHVKEKQYSQEKQQTIIQGIQEYWERLNAFSDESIRTMWRNTER